MRSRAKTVMAALALAGITGMYLRQVRQMGMLGLVARLRDIGVILLSLNTLEA